MDQATAAEPGRLWIIVLAAGESRRLGKTKQLLRAGGRTLLGRALRNAVALSDERVIVVLGATPTRLRAHVRRSAPRVRCIYNRCWRNGMGSSLQAGIRALPATAEAALVLLCDQPDVDLRSLRRLARRYRQRNRSTIVASHYAGRLGVPAIFPRRAFAVLRGLTADQGARALLNDAAPGMRIVAVAMPEAGIDIDTPTDAATVR